MGQWVEFASLVGISYKQYILKLRLLLGFLNGPGGTDFKKFRDLMRTNGMWDREKTIKSLELLEITWDRKTVSVGAAARKLQDVGSDEAFKEALYTRLLQCNVLLVKYVLEALDTESGGRLHSIHELYRMVTSYVYPGDYITLPSFQAWVDWMAATEYLKLVGIRWALGVKGVEAVSILKSMDVEEILEDLEEEEESDSDGADADEDEWGVPDSSPAEADVTPEEETADRGDFADLPPEPAAPSAEQIAAAEAEFLERFGGEEDSSEAEDTPQPVALTPAPLSQAGVPTQVTLNAPLPAQAPPPFPAVVHLSDDSMVLAEQIISWWNSLGDWPCFTAPDLGLSKPEGEEDSRRILLELAALAILIEGLDPQPQVFAFVSRLRESGFFSKLTEKGGAAIPETVANIDHDPWARPFVERLVHVQRLVERRTQDDFLGALRGCKTGREALLLLRDQWVGPSWVEAPFWILRELVRLELLKGEIFEAVAVVPKTRLLRNAARIGLVPVSLAQTASFEGLISAATRTAALFGARSGYGEALEVMDRALRPGA
jgi:hypothetical protein